jgi:hypothetical protein
MFTQAQQSNETMAGRRSVAWWLAGAAATGIGVALNLAAGRMPGSESFGAEDVVDAIGGLAIGGLGVLLLLHGIAAGLGRALLASSVLHGAVWLTGGLADAIAHGQPHPRWLARVLDVLNGVLFIPAFVLVVLAPLLLFPTGRLPSRRWRVVGWLAVGGTIGSMVGALLAPGPVDEDVPAWGTNPFGVDGLDGFCDALQGVGLIAVLVTAVAGIAAIVVRLITLRGVQRRQMWWFVVLIAPVIAMIAIDTDGLIPGALSAVIVFGLIICAIGYPLLGRPASTASPTRRRGRRSHLGTTPSRPRVDEP